jgi:hypothetical protein
MKCRRPMMLGAAVLALVQGACYYEPYHTSVSYHGYGYGHGYGGSSFSTSVFVSTGDPRWGYDPYCHAYYDYRRRAYYDPYLYGYYPVGYRPPVLIGVPHPYGWNHGVVMRPPVQVTNITLVNYHNRADLYRGTSHPWARNVKLDSTGSPSRPGANNRPSNRPVSPPAEASPGSFTRPSSGYGNRPSSGDSAISSPGSNTRPSPGGGWGSRPLPTEAPALDRPQPGRPELRPSRPDIPTGRREAPAGRPSSRPEREPVSAPQAGASGGDSGGSGRPAGGGRPGAGSGGSPYGSGDGDSSPGRGQGRGRNR